MKKSAPPMPAMPVLPPKVSKTSMSLENMPQKPHAPIDIAPALNKAHANIDRHAKSPMVCPPGKC